MKAIAEKIGRGHRESYPAHNFSSPKWKTLKRLGLFIILFSVCCQRISQDARNQQAGGALLTTRWSFLICSLAFLTMSLIAHLSPPKWDRIRTY
jgi:hypothetical protein